MKRKIGWVAAVLAVLALAAGWYWESPYWALRNLKAAAQSGDRAELQAAIDFPALRESVRSEMQAKMAAEMAKDRGSDTLGQMGQMFAMGLLNTMVDNMITPAGMAALVRRGRLKPRAAAGKDSESRWEIRHDGLDTFRAVPSASDGEKGPAFVFRRDGLSWKLSGLELPPDETLTLGGD